MIAINLLPKELRVRETRKFKVPIKLITIGAFAAFLILSLYNLFLYVHVREENRELKAQWKTLVGPSSEADRLERELGAQVVAEVDFYDTFIDPSLSLAHILNLISDLIPKNLTLSLIELSRKGRELKLNMNGISDSPKRDSTLVEIQNYANGLKDQLEEYMKPGTEGIGPRKPPEIKVQVETKSKHKVSTQQVITEFSVVLQSKGYTSD
jgi:hypothetical protein